MTEAYLGFGSNVGDKADLVRRGAECLAALEGIDDLELSPLYRTEPVGVTEQDWFVNAVARLRTDLSARALLERCLEVERLFKRERAYRWAPRTLDIDVLFYGNERIAEAGLVVPHPRMLERAFVLVPLADLSGDLKIEGRTVREWLAKLPPRGVQRLD